MTITDEVIEKGRIYLGRIDVNARAEVAEYNKKMQEAKRKAKRLDEYKAALVILNVLVILALSYATPDTVFSSRALGIIVIIVVVASFIFAILKDNYIVPCVASAFLIFLDWKFALLFVGNVFITFFIEKFRRELKEFSDYPKFKEIQIINEE